MAIAVSLVRFPLLSFTSTFHRVCPLHMAGRTPLHWAASKGFEATVQALLVGGANIAAKDIVSRRGQVCVGKWKCLIHGTSLESITARLITPELELHSYTGYLSALRAA